MSTLVRVYYIDAAITLPSAPGGGRFASDSVSVLKWPYISRAYVSADITATSTTAAPSGAKVAYVQVAAGSSVGFELNPPNRTTAADGYSPQISGNQTFLIGEGWSFSFIEV